MHQPPVWQQRGDRLHRAAGLPDRGPVGQQHEPAPLRTAPSRTPRPRRPGPGRPRCDLACDYRHVHGARDPARWSDGIRRQATSSRTEMERLNRGYAVRSIDATICALTSPQSGMNERYRNRADTWCVGELRILFTRESTSEIPGSSSLRSGCQPTAGCNTPRDAGLMRRPRSTHGRFRTYLGRPREHTPLAGRRSGPDRRPGSWGARTTSRGGGNNRAVSTATASSFLNAAGTMCG